jgi:vacuolar-type H+-ATPase subunit H
MSDPIQTVLQAQADARLDVEQAQQQAESRVNDARLEARRIRQRHDQRTLRVIRGFETKQQRALAEQVRRLEQDAEQSLQQFRQLAEKRLQQLIDKTVSRIWPES